MRVKISSESGSWVLLESLTEITDRMTGTQLLRYLFNAARELCPDEYDGDQLKLRVRINA